MYSQTKLGKVVSYGPDEETGLLRNLSQSQKRLESGLGEVVDGL